MASGGGGIAGDICQSFESGDDVFDAGSNAAVSPVVLVADDAAGLVASGG
jgi:hypothetical protein